MSMSSHLEELRRKHEVLSEKVEAIQRAHLAAAIMRFLNLRSRNCSSRKKLSASQPPKGLSDRVSCLGALCRTGPCSHQCPRCDEQTCQQLSVLVCATATPAAIKYQRGQAAAHCS